MEKENEVLVQNSLSSSCPAFAVHPHWYIAGCEKKVKIGSKSFNYIDYLEAWCHHDCNTHRDQFTSLATIRDQIKAAFAEIDEYNQDPTGFFKKR